MERRLRGAERRPSGGRSPVPRSEFPAREGLPGWPVAVKQMRPVWQLPHTSSWISASIGSVGSWLMVLPGHDAPIAVTISSLHSLVKGAGSVPPIHSIIHCFGAS